MTTRLFDEIERKDTGPKPESEADYEYINRSARPEVEKIRSLLEDWFSRYPEKEQTEFRKRLSGKETFAAAFFELYVHEILLRQGFSCKVHPEIEGCDTHPEFLVSYKELNFYVEATVPDLPQDDAINQRLCDGLIDKLNETPSEYYLDVDFEGLLRNRPPLKEIRDWLKNKPSVGSSFELKQDKAKIVITITPYKKETGSDASVATIGYGCSWGSPGATMLRKAIHKKATRYGKLERPYVIAINVKETIREIDVVNVLFGDLYVKFDRKTGKSITGRDLRTAKLITPNGPQNTRVSGIIILENLVPWGIAHATPVLWHTPWAARPFPPALSALWQLPQQIPKEVYEKKEGKAVSELLGLPPNWPWDRITTL